jgi:hypothetical protein
MYMHILYPFVSSYFGSLICPSSFASRRRPISPRPKAADASRCHEEARRCCLMPALPSFIYVSRLGGVYMELPSSLLLPKPRAITVDDLLPVGARLVETRAAFLSRSMFAHRSVVYPLPQVSMSSGTFLVESPFCIVLHPNHRISPPAMNHLLLTYSLCNMRWLLRTPLHRPGGMEASLTA